MVHPMEIAHYNQWAWRLEVSLLALFPRILWKISRLHELAGIPHPVGIPPWYRIVATTRGGRRSVVVSVKVAPLVNEAISPRLLIALGRELEHRLATTLEEG